MVRKFKKNSMNLVHALFGFLLLSNSQAFAGSVECKILMECVGGSEAACRLRFKAAERISRKGTGAKLLEEGKKLDIPPDMISALEKAFIEDYQSAADTPGASPAAKGNVGHMKDHFEFLKQHEEKFKALGIDIPSLRLAVAAHDIGKGFLDKAISDYIKLKTEGKKTELAPFLRDFILSHELHSIAGIPRVVKETMKQRGIDTTTPEGKTLVQKYSEQIMEAIRLHNGVDVTGDLRAKYPTLTEEEIQQVEKAWWPENYRKFARDLGLRQEEYGGDAPLIGVALNMADRATLTSPSAPAKLIAQNLGFMPWGIDLIVASTQTPAKGNVPIIEAQGAKLRAEADTPEKLEAVRGIVAAAQRFNASMIELGVDLKVMNERAMKLDIPQQEGTVLFQRLDGNWIRINGQIKSDAFIERWDGEGFVREEKSAETSSPVDLLMSELQKRGMWPPQ
ncbi:hypothetical protein EBQ74_00260 [bacterium]|nr:hypothetical protein [bacterium]